MTKRSCFPAQLSLLREVHYAFNHPDVMYIGRRSQVTSALAKAENAALAELRKQLQALPEGDLKAGVTIAKPCLNLAFRRRRQFVGAAMTLASKIASSGPADIRSSCGYHSLTSLPSARSLSA
jgi:hypothetical protein